MSAATGATPPAATVAAITTAYDVLSAAWPADVVDVSSEAHFLIVTFRASANALGRELRWDHHWPTIDADGLQTGTTLRTPAAGVRLVQDATGYFIETFGTTGGIREPYSPGSSFTIGIGPFIDGRPSALHPGLWDSRLVEYDLASVGSHVHASDGFLLVGHVGQRPPGVNPAGQPLSGDGQLGVVGEPLARPFVVEVLRADGQPGTLARVDSNTWTGAAKAGVPVTFSIVGQPAGATGASLSAASGVTDAGGRAEVRFTAGSLPGQYLVRATVRNAVLGAALDFPVEVRKVQALLLQLEDVPAPVRVAARGDPVTIGITTPRVPSRQRVTAVGVHEGPDGALGTTDDLLLGPVPADWSVAGGAKNDARFLEADGSGKVTRRPTVTIDAGPTAGASKLAVSFTPLTGGRATRGTFGLDVVEVAFVLLDEEGAIDQDPDVRDASGINLPTVRVALNGRTIDPLRWEGLVTDFVARRAKHPTGNVLRFGPTFAELRRGANVLRVQARDVAGNELPASAGELTYDFPSVPGGGITVVAVREEAP